MDGERFKKETRLKKKKKKKNGSFKSIFTHADRVDKLLMIIGFIGAVGDGILFPVMLLVISKLMNRIGIRDRIHSGSDHHSFTHTIQTNALIMCYMACGRFIFAFLEGYCWTRTAERQASALRTTYLKAVPRQEIGYFDLQVTTTAEVIASVSTDSLIIQEFIGEKVPASVMHISTFVACYLVSFFILWKLAIVAFPFGLVMVIPGLICGRVMMGIARKIRKEYSKAQQIVEQATSSIRTVYSFVGEKKTFSEYSVALRPTVQLGIRQGIAKGLAVGSSSIGLALWSFIAYYGSRLVMYHGAKGGTIYAVAAALTLGNMALGFAFPNLRYLSEASAAAKRTIEIIKRESEIDPEDTDGETITPNNNLGEIEFKQVEFAYPSRPESIILQGFSLKIPAGRTTALVGKSGCGKSTVVSLLLRFYNPVKGQIFLDGVSIDKLQLKWLRSQIGLVNQEPALFATTIKDNILFGKENASLEEVIEAAKAANAHHFITQLPLGYDTQVGERGVQMSGGQKQRIAIARAIIKEPKILLLDEATSALDLESEKVVQEALDKLTIGVTTIIIAHRLSTIRNADRIVVVQNGQVTEISSHDQLIQDENNLNTSPVRSQPTDDETTCASVSSLNVNLNSSKGARNSSSFRKSSCPDSSVVPSSSEDHQIGGNKPSLKRLFAMNLPEWRQALLGCVSAILCGAVQPSFAYTMGTTMSAFFLTDHGEIKRKTRIYSFVFLGLALLSLLINVSQHYNFAAMGEYLTQRVRERMLSKILTFEIGWFDEEGNATGVICSRLARDANVVRSLVGDRMSLLVQAISSVTIACTIGLIISWRLALAMMAIQPLVVGIFYSKHTLLKTMSKKATESQNTSSKIAAEAVSNVRTVAAFNSQPQMLQMLKKAQQGSKGESIRQSWLAGIGLGVSNCLLLLVWPFAFWFGGRLVVAGSLTGEAFFQVFIILFSVGRVIAEAGTMTNDIAKGSNAVGSVFAILDRQSLIEPEDSQAYKPHKIEGHIELVDVDFAYPSRPNVMIFTQLSLQIEAGQSTAIVGQSGSGKSTVISLIERYYDPVKGSVKIDGRDLKSYDLRSLRKHIALVSQEPALFSGTIRENITYGAPLDLDETEVIEAAKAARAHDFISGLKDGYDTLCGDKGVQLSGGQKQRIAIARAIMKKPAILLLDEATSALDSESEKEIQNALEKVVMGRTSVIVAHRLTTIQHCHNIVVLDNGKLLEKGSPASLLAKGPSGAYFSLVSLQNNNSL